MMKLEKDHFYLILFCCSSLLFFFLKLPFFVFIIFCSTAFRVYVCMIHCSRACEIFSSVGFYFFSRCCCSFVVVFTAFALVSGSGWQWRKGQHIQKKNEERKSAESDTARITSDVSLWNMQLARKWMNLLNSALVFFFSFFCFRCHSFVRQSETREREREKLSFCVQLSRNKISISFANKPKQVLRIFNAKPFLLIV